MKNFGWAAKGLTFSLVMSYQAWAQQSAVSSTAPSEVGSTATTISSNAVASAQPSAQPVVVTTAPAAPLSTQPVSVSQSMAPAEVPAVAGNPNINNSTTVNVTSSTSSGSEAEADATAQLGGRTESLKRERQLREADNESRLIEKLEKGRLEDETKRAEDIEKFKTGGYQGSHEVPDSLQSEPVAAPVAAPVVEANNSQTTVVAPVIVNTIEEKREHRDDHSSFRVSPYFGRRWVSGNYELKVNNRFATGVALEGNITRWLALEGSFNYAQDEFRSRGHSVAPTPTPYGAPTPGSYNRYIRTRNTFGVLGGAKAGWDLGRFRPFVAGGFGGRFSKYNIDDAYTRAVAQAAGWQRSTNSMIATAGTGLDFRVARNFGVGTRFDYEMSLTKRNSSMNRIYGDNANAYRLSANVQVLF